MRQTPLEALTHQIAERDEPEDSSNTCENIIKFFCYTKTQALRSQHSIWSSAEDCN